MGNTPDFTTCGYNILEELGNYYYEDRAVYLAHDQHHNRFVVLRVYHFGFAADEAEVAHLTGRERETLRAFTHPGIPQCFDYFIARDADNADAGNIVLVLEHKPGMTLEKGFHLTLPQLQSLILQVLDILAYGQRLEPPVFHYALNEGDIVVDYLPQGEVHISVLNFGKRRDMGVIPRPEERWQYDLKKLGAIIVRLLSGKVTSDFTLFQKHFYPVSRLPGSRFVHGIQQLLGESKTGSFADAMQAYQAFAKIPVIAPVYPLRHLPYPALLAYFGISMMLCWVGFDWEHVLSVVHRVGATITQIPLTVTISFIPGLSLDVHVMHLLAWVLGVLGVLLVLVGIYCLALEGIVLGIFLIVLAVLVLGVCWLVGFMVHLVIVVAPMAIAGILVLSFYTFLANCWGQMRQEKFTVGYTLLTVILGTLAAVAITGDVLFILFGQRHLVFFLVLTFMAIPLWLYLLTYPANRHKANVERQQRAQALVLKG